MTREQAVQAATQPTLTFTSYEEFVPAFNDARLNAKAVFGEPVGVGAVIQECQA